MDIETNWKDTIKQELIKLIRDVNFKDHGSHSIQVLIQDISMIITKEEEIFMVINENEQHSRTDFVKFYTNLQDVVTYFKTLNWSGELLKLIDSQLPSYHVDNTGTYITICELTPVPNCNVYKISPINDKFMLILSSPNRSYSKIFTFGVPTDVINFIYNNDIRPSIESANE